MTQIREKIKERELFLEAQGKELKYKPSTRILMPNGIELQYYRYLLNYVRTLINLTKEIYYPALENAVFQAKEVVPAYDSIQLIIDTYTDSILEGLAKTQIALNSEFTEFSLFNNATFVANEVADFSREELQRLTRQAVGVDIFTSEPWLADTVQSFAENNVKLIKTVPEKYFNEIRQLSVQGIQQGKSFRAIKSEIIERQGVSKWNAERIARDQILTLNSQMNEYRQREIGVSSYVWRTMGDNRVRPRHTAREGKVFFWNNPPSGGHPGSEVLCRCFAEPNLEKFL